MLFYLKLGMSWVQWLTTVVSVTWEVEAAGLQNST